MHKGFSSVPAVGAWVHLRFCGACAGFRQLHEQLQCLAACNCISVGSKSASVSFFPFKRRLLLSPGGKAQAIGNFAFDFLIAAHVPGPVGTNPRASCADGLSAGLYRMHFFDEPIPLWNIWSDSLDGEARVFTELIPLRVTLQLASAGTDRRCNAPELPLHGSHDVVRLIPLPSEQRVASHQLPYYAANAPDIDFLRIPPIIQQELHCNVPMTAYV